MLFTAYLSMQAAGWLNFLKEIDKVYMTIICKSAPRKSDKKIKQLFQFDLQSCYFEA